MSEEEKEDIIAILSNTDISCIELAENVDLLNYQKCVNGLLYLYGQEKEKNEKVEAKLIWNKLRIKELKRENKLLHTEVVKLYEKLKKAEAHIIEYKQKYEEALGTIEVMKNNVKKLYISKDKIIRIVNERNKCYGYNSLMDDIEKLLED